MTPLRFAYLIVGLGLFAVVVANTDLSAAGGHLVEVGVLGALTVIAIYVLAFLCDVASWQLMLSSAALDIRWLYRLWKIRMVGEAFNLIVPAASFGGEPVKAVMLKKRHAIGYRESGASIVMTKTTNLIGLIVFGGVGLVLMLDARTLPTSYSVVAGSGLAALGVGVAGFFAVQRWRMASRIAGWLAQRRFGRRLETALVHIQDIDERFVAFYRHRPGRFAAALGLSLGNWLLGMIELYVIMYFLGHPITLSEAWIVEAVIQLVRAGSFFIPANLGALEAGFVVIVGALTGSPSLGLAAALVRRARDVLWIAWGLWLGWLMSFSPRVVAEEVAKTPDG